MIMKMVNRLANDKIYENSNILSAKIKDLLFYCNKKTGNYGN